MSLAANALQFAFSSTAWYATGLHTGLETHTWTHVMSTGVGTLSHVISLLSEPERLIVVGLSLIALSMVVRRRASR